MCVYVVSTCLYFICIFLSIFYMYVSIIYLPSIRLSTTSLSFLLPLLPCSVHSQCLPPAAASTMIHYALQKELQLRGQREEHCWSPLSLGKSSNVLLWCTIVSSCDRHRGNVSIKAVPLNCTEHWKHLESIGLEATQEPIALMNTWLALGCKP